MDIEKHKYPIGKYDGTRPTNREERAALIEQIRRLPGELSAALAELSDAQLDTPYREGGWTVRQLVHHIADSHMNALVRTKFALTEGNHVIKAYNQTDWVNTPDATLAPEVSLKFLAALHEKWTLMLAMLTDEQFARKLAHPDRPGQDLDVNWLLALYAWHGRHHTAHITELRKRMSW
jgi:uncharacterized damage-inducible protein DinB